MNWKQLVLALFVLGVAVGLAQEAPPIPAVEVGASLSFTNFHPGAGAPSFTASGASGTLVYNFNRVLGAVADMGGYHKPGDAHFNPTTFTFLFGPRLSLRRSRVTPYVQTLFGAARQWTSFAGAYGDTTKYNGFAAAFGGGIDVRVKDHILVKPFQMEYLLTQVTNPWSTAGTQNNLRYSAGVVLTLSSK